MNTQADPTPWTAPVRPIRKSFLGVFALLLLSSACGSDNNTAGNTGGSAGQGAVGEGGEPGQARDGEDGKDGTDGKDGKDGVDGQDGEDGAPGTVGEDGADGEDGKDGVTPGPVAIFGTVPKKKLTTINSATFTFGCSDGDCDYEYSVDTGEFVAGSSPLVIPPQPAGEHRLRVRARSKDPANTLGWGKSASYTWTARKPNILTIVADDLGFSDLGVLGGEIDTPNLNALAGQGRLLTGHQVGTVCAITRAMLISGTDNHRVGQGTMAVADTAYTDQPGYEGYLNDRSLSVAQLLRDGGYRSYISGKWHLGARTATATTGSGKTPDQWGFDRSFALLGGAPSNHFTHETAASRTYVLDGAYSGVDTAGHPAEGSYSADFYTDKLIGFIDDGLTSNADKPFFAYAAYTSPHWPLQAPDGWRDKYKGKYDGGYEPIVRERLRRLRESGLLPHALTPSPGFPEAPNRWPASPNNGAATAKYTTPLLSPADGYVDYGPGSFIKNWATLTDAEKKAQSRYMELYASMVEHLDYSVGRLIQHLKNIGQYEYTFIIFHSDSGADGWPIAATDPLTIDTQNAADPVYSSLGKDSNRNIKYGIRWAEVSNTPLSQLKGFQGQGGLGAPAIVHLPGQTQALPPVHHFTHITDDTATILQVGGVTPPSTPAPPLIEDGVNKNADKVVYDGRYVYPVTGVSFLSAVQQEKPAPTRSQSFGGETYGRAFILSADQKWRARWTEPPYGPIDGHWELFQVEVDRAETKDLSASQPALVQGLVNEWKAYAQKFGVKVPVRPRGYY